MSKENFKDVETIIGPSVKVEGDFKADGNVIIEGEVDGNFSTKKSLRVGNDAQIKANVEAGDAWVGGTILGNLKVAGHLELSSNAKVKGDIETSLLTIETGAQVNGNIKMGEVVMKEAQEKDGEDDE